MVATSPVTAIKQARIKHLPLFVNSVANSAVQYLMGTATASTAPVLGISGRIVRVQCSGISGTTGDLSLEVHVLQGTAVPAAGTLAMTCIMSGTAKTATSEVVGAQGAVVVPTDRIAVIALGGSPVALGATITAFNALITIEVDE